MAFPFYMPHDQGVQKVSRGGKPNGSKFFILICSFGVFVFKYKVEIFFEPKQRSQ